MEVGVQFAKIVFRVAGIWGVIILLPMYFLYERYGQIYPPPLTHPEVFYGFLGVTMAWQIAFLIIASDPARFRPIIIAAMFEKFVYVAMLLLLLAQKQIVAEQAAVGVPDLFLGILFVIAFLKTRRRGVSVTS